MLIPAGYVTTVYDPVFTLNADKTRYVSKASNTPTTIPEPGLPFSLVFRAEPGKEDVLLRIASAYEAASKRRVPPPAFGPLLATPQRRDLDLAGLARHLLSVPSHRDLPAMTDTQDTRTESRAFEADVAKLLHMMVHSVYSNKDVFLRELISNAADACERLRYEAIANPGLLGDDPKLHITVTADADKRQLTVEDNGIGMSRDEMVEALGTIARSGTRAFMEKMEAAQGGEGATLIGQFGVGFYSAFMVADRVDVVSRHAGTEEAWLWSSDGKGTFSVTPAALEDAPKRGTRVVLHLMEDAKSYTERYNLERIVKAQSGHVPVPIAIVDKPGETPSEVSDGAALWTKPQVRDQRRGIHRFLPQHRRASSTSRR